MLQKNSVIYYITEQWFEFYTLGLTMSLKVLVDAEALRQVLDALNGPGHYIRELQVTRNLPGNNNPINTLVEQYNAFADEHNKTTEGKPA